MGQLIHWIIPTTKNNYRAKLIETPALVIVLLALVLVNTGLGNIPVKSVSAAVSTSELVELHNQERAKNNLGQLTLNSALSNSAQKKAAAMLKADCWSHYCPPGVSPWDFFVEAGYEYLYAGENLAEGYFENEEVMIAWMNSPTHRENILRKEYTEVGFGIVTGTFQGVPNTTVIAVHFGTPRVKAANNQQPLEFAAPTIVSPKNNQSFNSSSVIISGIASNADVVEIFNSGKKWQTAPAEEGIFTKRVEPIVEGDYKITARSINGFNTSIFSNPVSFSVDHTENPIAPNQIVMVETQSPNIFTLQISEPGLSNLSLKVNNSTINLEQVNEILWQTNISIAQLESKGSLSLFTTDLAGNTWAGEIKTSDIYSNPQLLGIDSQLSQLEVDRTFLKSQLNAMILIGLLALFWIDFLVLYFTGNTNPQRSRLNLHFGLFMVVLLVVISGSIAGQIGTGINL